MFRRGSSCVSSVAHQASSSMRSPFVAPRFVAPRRRGSLGARVSFEPGDLVRRYLHLFDVDGDRGGVTDRGRMEHDASASPDADENEPGCCIGGSACVFELLGGLPATVRIDVFRLVSYRYGRGSSLITTNKGIRDSPGLLACEKSWPPPSSTVSCTAAMSWTSKAEVERRRPSARCPSRSRIRGREYSTPSRSAQPTRHRQDRYTAAKLHQGVCV